MATENLVNVTLDSELVGQLLHGLLKGAAGRSLKVVISTDGCYHIDSKELRMLLEIDSSGAAIQSIHVHNTKQQANINADTLEIMHLTDIGKDVVKELKSKYSPVFHSLADNIIVFGRAYGHD